MEGTTIPATSVAQQRLFGMVLAAKRGQLKNPSAKVQQVASHISESSARDFAKTKDTGLPEHVKPKKRKKPAGRLAKGMSQPCPFCRGEGRYGAYECEACHGTGRRRMAQRVEVRKAMQVIQLPGMVVISPGEPMEKANTMGFNFKPGMKPSYFSSSQGPTAPVPRKKKATGPVHDEQGDEGFEGYKFKPGMKPSYVGGKKGPSFSGGFKFGKAMERLAELQKSANEMDPEVLKRELLQLNTVIEQMRAARGHQAG